MATFSYTKERKLSVGNRIGYVYDLANVQTTGSILYTPFKKITTYLIETTSPSTNTITVTNNQDSKGHGLTSQLTFAADAESQGKIVVVGLL